MSARRKRWVLREPAPPEFVAELAYSPIVSNLLYQRDMRDKQAAEEFLHSDYRTGLHDPFLMKDMDIASARIARAIKNGEPMAVYGDYDTDGVTAVALLMQAIPAMGGNLRPYIPHRVREGYGLNREAVERLANEGISLLITVDCGISNVAEVARARELGIDVVVTDHHSPPEELPQANAVVNPKQKNCSYPYNQLVGVGIAYKLVQAIVRQGIRLPLRGRDLLDVVAVGTVTDMGPLTGENRVLVKHGLEALNATTRPGLRALINASGLTMGKIKASDIGFGLGPRINAAGRLDDATRSYDLLLAEDLASAEKLAFELNRANRQRQDLTKEVQEHAKALAESDGTLENRIIIIAGEDYPAGVVGLVAGRLVEEWGRPVLILERKADVSVGSARSVSGFNIIEALRRCGDLFVRYGGHSMAAGFTIENAKLPELNRRLQAIAAEELSDEMLVPKLEIDLEIPLSEVSWELIQLLATLEPYGQANPQPVFMSRNLRVVSAQATGADKQHLSMMVNDGSDKPPFKAIAFRLGHLAPALARYPYIDLAYHVEEREWNGERSIQLNVRDFRRATQA
jgi:single-stranded-DNA-specific exonuclease RecJ